jgi:hypothetical protein
VPATGIQLPPQDALLGAPVGVALLELLHRGGLFAHGGIAGVEGAEHRVDRM